MKTIIGFFTAMGLLIPTAYAQTGSTFCPYPAFCVEVGAGNADLEDRCLLARDSTSLVRLYDRVGKAEDTGLSDTASDAIRSLNTVRAQRNLNAVTMENFASSQIAFLAVSLDQVAGNERPAIVFEKDSEKTNAVSVDLQISVVPDVGERKSQTTSTPFYRIVALDKAFLSQFGVASWSKAELTLESADGKTFSCTSPAP